MLKDNEKKTPTICKHSIKKKNNTFKERFKETIDYEFTIKPRSRAKHINIKSKYTEKNCSWNITNSR